MPTVELIKLIALLLGVSVPILILGMILPLMYPRLKLLISDVAGFVGFLGKWVRKTSLATEVEGAVNSFVKQYNSELITPFLPDCDVEWVTEGNHEAVMTPGKVIVRLSFSQDRDLNIYNAATLFVRIGLLPRTKPFLSRMLASAIDLLIVRNLLKDAQRTALRVQR